MTKEIVVLLLDGIIYQLDVTDVGKKVAKMNTCAPVHDTIFVTFQSDELTNFLEDRIHFAKILDIECLDVQIRQSIGLKPPPKKWTVPNMLHTYLGIEEKRWDVEEYAEVLKNIATCYLAMKTRGEAEWKRITEIELLVNRVLYETQSRGIFINHEEIEPLCRELHQKIYSLKNTIQLEYDFIGDSLDDYVSQNNIYQGELSRSIEEKLEKDHPEIGVFRKLQRTKQNFNCLIMLSAVRKGVNLCKPLFKGFGTTTGRIILRDPALQNLSKKFRSLLKNENLPANKRYVYVDFGQFEAGVLAGLSGNSQLQALYEQNRVYEELARRTKSDRDKAKMYFYCFVYGGIVWKGADNFFKTYGLQKTVDEVNSEALKKGFIETPFGNRRVCGGEEDKKWILNHYIQGTSSLIFKQALIDVYQSFYTKVELILPMHDAALYIVDNDVQTEHLIHVFRGAFKKWLPNVNPIVKEKDFFEE